MMNMEELKICRRSMTDYGTLDWAYHTILTYQHLAMVYEGKGLPQKAKAFIDEGWRTLSTNKEVPFPDSFIDTMVETKTRIYQSCGLE